MSIFSKAAGEITGSIMDGLGNLFTSDDERNQAKIALNGLTNNIIEVITKAFNEQEQQRTDRHDSDMKSDSWLSKNIRPLTLVYLLVVFTGLVIGDSASTTFTVAERWVTLLETLLTAAFSFYFVMRGSEKLMSIYAGMKEKAA